MLDQSKRDALRRILDISVLMQASTAKHADPGFSKCISPESPIIFPPPPHVLPVLRSVGLTDSAATKVVDLFSTRCFELQAFYRDKLFEMQSLSSPTVHRSLRNYVQNVYSENIARFQSEILHFARSHQDKACTTAMQTAKQPKATFNHDYVPALERYFQYNAYPSAADRALMARKSLMTARQIEVWFQNHRNRARKEGKVLARWHQNSPLPPDLFVGLDEKMGDLVRIDEQHLVVDVDESDLEGYTFHETEDNVSETTIPTVSISHTMASSVTNSLSPPAPLYAFPTRFIAPPISCLRLTTRESTFPPPKWPRQPVTRPSSKGISPLASSDIDELVDLFARLTVREGSRQSSRRKLSPSPLVVSGIETNAATFAFTTTLPSGRHPAFVVTHDTSRCSQDTCPPVPCTSTPSKPSSLRCPPRLPSRRRKAPQLPRRAPTSSPVRFPVSNKSYHPYPTPSRSSSSSSFSSVPPSMRSNSWSSSSSIASSSSPATPEHELSPLPTLSHDLSNAPKSPSDVSPSWTVSSVPSSPPGHSDNNLFVDFLSSIRTSCRGSFSLSPHMGVPVR